LQLFLEAVPDLGDGVPERIMKVEANGTLVGTLAMVNSDDQFFSLTIKATANSAAFLKLHFSFSPAPSPGSGDARPREIGLARLALVPIGHPINQETHHATALTRQ